MQLHNMNVYTFIIRVYPHIPDPAFAKKHAANVLKVVAVLILSKTESCSIQENVPVCFGSILSCMFFENIANA